MAKGGVSCGAVIAALAVWASAFGGETVRTAEGGALRERIARAHKIVGEDMWYGFRRTKFAFDGYVGWVVEPSVAPAEGHPWTWTMQWADAFVVRTGVPELLRRGWRHVTLEAFAGRASDADLGKFAAFQKFLVDELGFAPKAHLVGMSWGGFFSTRYAAHHPENVAKIYLDAPLMNFAGYTDNTVQKVGPWAAEKPQGKTWSDDPRMPVNLAAPIAKAGIPVLLAYGGQDQTVTPSLNCELFVPRFKAAGGSIDVRYRYFFGHHPHGFDPEDNPIVSFFEAK